MLVQFIDVGSNSRNWISNVTDLSFKSLFSEFKIQMDISNHNNRNNIRFEFDEKKNEGNIVAGKFLLMGKFKVIEEEQTFQPITSKSKLSKRVLPK